MWRKKTETLVSLAVFYRVSLGSGMSLGLILLKTNLRLQKGRVSQTEPFLSISKLMMYLQEIALLSTKVSLGKDCQRG